MKIAALFALTVALAASPAFAQDAAPACPALPAELAGWTSGTPLAAAATPTGLARALVKIGNRTDLALAPTADVSFATTPNKAPAPDTHSGMAIFTIGTGGTYRVALGTSAWINVVHDGKFLSSTAHTHKLGCAGVRKLIDFALTPGNYVLQIEGGRDAVAGLLIARLP
ncbi:MAG: homogentisate 1,2-dioxygenase [Sphingomonas sp.]|uniref:homogentisate 1,2-dioxygenase n=1 Tax=Sphingomonas sp. TaxID=28214 RepID=UPI00356523C2